MEPTRTTSHYTFLVKEARYGGTYEGGAWTAFSVNDRGDGCYEVPDGAWGGDVQAAEWWWNGPSVPAASGDTPGSALENLRRQLDFPDTPRFSVGDPVTVGPAPDFWFHDGIGTVVEALREPRLGEFAPPGATQWEFVVEFDDAVRLKIPDPYLRAANGRA